VSPVVTPTTTAAVSAAAALKRTAGGTAAAVAGEWERLETVTVSEVVFAAFSLSSGTREEHDGAREGKEDNTAGTAAAAASSHKIVGPDLYPGAGGSEKLLLELEDLGYACECNDLDCICFTNPKRLAVYHRGCASQHHLFA
jgi:hypothetical protein